MKPNECAKPNFPVSSVNKLSKLKAPKGGTLADLGEGPASPPPPPPPILDQTEARRAEKIFWRLAFPPYLKIWMSAQPPPPPLIGRSESSIEANRWNKIVMGKKILVPCLDVIMIAIFAEKYTVKDHISNTKLEKGDH